MFNTAITAVYIALITISVHVIFCALPKHNQQQFQQTCSGRKVVGDHTESFCDSARQLRSVNASLELQFAASLRSVVFPELRRLEDVQLTVMVGAPVFSFSSSPEVDASGLSLSVSLDTFHSSASLFGQTITNLTLINSNVSLSVTSVQAFGMAETLAGQMLI